jgi:superfamily I DNA and/or RNA helicase
MRKGRIVMAGDPCQLGPVVKSKMSKDHGMEISLLERLMERDIYRPGKSYRNLTS